MEGMYGITGIRVKAIEASHENLEEVNAFLEEYNGNIIDIQASPMMYGVTKYIIVYKAMEYKIRYEDNTGNCDSIETYQSEEAAEAAIAEELEEVKEYFKGRDYDYGEFVREDGLATEIWACGDDEYASWTRLWK